MIDRNLAIRFSNTTKWFGTWLVLLTVLVAVYGVCRRFDLGLSFDAATLFSPYFTLVADLARSGQILLWNPWSNCGSPDAAYVEMGSFSPVTLVTAWVTGGGEDGFVIYWLTIWGLGGTGMLVLGRHLGSPAWCALAVSVSYMFSGFYLGNATHTSWIYAFSFLPWILWRLDRGLLTRQIRPSIEAGALYGLAALAGHPALIVLNGLFLGAWTVGRCLFRDPACTSPSGSAGSAKRWQTWAAAALHLALLVGIALVILSPAYAIFFQEGAGYSDRTGYVPRHIAVADQALPTTALGTLTSPYFPFLKSFNPQLWPNVWQGLTCNYIGAIVPALALLAMSRYRWSLWYGWLLALAILCLACAVGPALPIRGWLYDLCPPTRYFRHSSVFRAYFLFALAVLAFFGGREMSQKRQDDWAALSLSACYLLILAAAGYAFTLWQMPNWGTGIMIGHAHFLLVWLGLPLLAVAAWNQSVEFAENAAPVLLVSLALLDGAMTFVQSGGVILQKRTAPRRVESVDLFRTGLNRERHPIGEYPTNDNLYHKQPLLENFNTLNNRFHTRAGLGTADWAALSTSWCDEEILAAGSMSPAGPDRTDTSRIGFSRDAVEILPTIGNFSAFVSRARSLGSMPFVLHQPDQVIAALSNEGYHAAQALQEALIHEAPAAERIAIALDRYTPTELAFRVECPADGWILVTDRWAKGWQAQVNGRDTPVLVGNFVFRALPVSKGTQSIEFRYQPFGHPWLGLLSWISMCAIGVGSARSVIRGQRVRD